MIQPHGLYAAAGKRACDLVLSALGLVLLSPLLLGCAAAVRASSPGPILFRHRRVGLGGRDFDVLKFRSMAAGGAGRAITVSGDPRVTRVGAILRRFKLDELPQLWNVVTGDMSIVGPRPEVRRYVERFPEQYRAILVVRPGLTDFASVTYRDEERILATFPDPEEAYCTVVLPQKLHLAERYVRSMSLATDVRLILATLQAIVR
jgi:lipopolysaccharide/colanic/teichoic acid biosynthesis glycosyltransferase